MHEELEQESYLDILVQSYEQHEQNLADLEDSRFGEIYLDEGECFVTRRKAYQRKFKKEKFYD